jgi:S-adenosylmethionine-diacylgycerolhomoserine-N-methlytransferase
MTEALAGYYRLHSRIYDATRWTFLHGRQRILDIASADLPPAPRILEIGCGTGRNLAHLARRHPKARITGLDLSGDMLDRARPKLAMHGERIQLLHRPYDGAAGEGEGFDLILFSYALSMMNPGFEEVLAGARGELQSGGRIAVVDFHDSPHRLFRSWMGRNHVRMEGQLPGVLRREFEPIRCEIHSAMAGLWRWLIFTGKKQA